MKKLAPILLIIVFLFNVFGYYGLLIGLSLKNRHETIKRLDAGSYNTDHTFILKIPLSIPYHVNQNEFERVDGEIEHGGEFYRLVKQRISNDTLYLVCFVDNQSKKIKQGLSDYVKTFADKHHTSRSGNRLLQDVIKDYIASSVRLEQATAGWRNNVTRCLYNNFYDPEYITAIAYPPEA